MQAPCKRLLPWLLALMTTGCVFVPVTTEVYDPGCRIQAKEMTLQPVQVGGFANCRGNECATLLVFVGATAAASAVVSGSIVVVGNVAYWFEKQGRCNREK
jgi:hypothetical protein